MKGHRGKLLLGAVVLVLALYTLFGDKGVVANARLYRTQQRLADENARLREENGRLHAEVERLRSNPAYIEEIARKELGLVGAKEDVILLDKKGDARPPPHPAGVPPVPRRAAAAAAAAHLLLFTVVGSGPGGPPGGSLWPVSALAALAVLSFRGTLARRRGEGADLCGPVAFAAASLLEIHALVPLVAVSRIVPALLAPAFALLLRPLESGTALAISLAWLSVTGGGGVRGAIGSAPPYLLLMVPAYAGGFALRAFFRFGAGDGRMRIGEDAWEDLLVSWDGPAPPGEETARTPAGEESSGRILGEGIGRILEGLFPLTGADALLFVRRSTEPGMPFRVAAGLGRGGIRVPPGAAVDSGYAPLREAILFRRASQWEGGQAASWLLAAALPGETPTGVAAVPVVDGDAPAGALLALRVAEGEWSDPVIPLLETGAFLAAREIANARRARELSQRISSLEGLHSMVMRIARLGEPGPEGPRGDAVLHGVYGEAVERVRERLGADRVLLVEADGKDRRGRIAALSPAHGSGTVPGPPGDAGEGAEVSLEGTYVAWVLDSGVHRIFSGLREDPGRHPVLPPSWTDTQEDAVLLVPVSAQGFRGVLACASHRPRHFLASDAEAVKEYARIVQVGISHARNTQALAAEAEEDGLTGLLNQRSFRDRLSRVLGRLDGRRPCAVVALDLDHFKRINDTFGHPAGDEVLRTTAAVIRKTIRKADFAGRCGGEEFALFLDHADRTTAFQVAERLRLLIRRTRFGADGRDIRATVSLGIACCPDDGTDVETLVRRADEALYRSKQGGRDRVTLASSPIDTSTVVD